MYYNPAQVAHDNKCRDKYNEFMEKLRTSKKEDDEMLYEHILKLERESLMAKKELEEHRKFFEALQKLLPKQSSIYDILG